MEDVMFGRPKSVDAILSKFSKYVDDLEAHASAQSAKVLEHDKASIEHDGLAKLAAAEASRAMSVAGKIKSLVA
jgi:hypothetical protein